MIVFELLEAPTQAVILTSIVCEISFSSLFFVSMCANSSL